MSAAQTANHNLDNNTGNDNPYVGPRTFERDQAHLFFGREREAEELFSRVVSQRLVLFYAQSGAGKSSLINTQLIPKLEEAGFVVLPVARVGGDLLGGITETIDNIYLFNLMLSLNKSQRDPARLAHLSLSHFLEHLTSEDGKNWYYEERQGELASDEWRVAVSEPVELTATRHSSLATRHSSLATPNYVLIIDQFEEIITTHGDRWTEREAFFRQLEAAMLADPTLWVVLTLREDFVAALDPYAPLLSDKLRARYYMQRMGLDAAREAITKPAEARQRHFQPAAVDRLLHNLSQVRVAGKATTESGQYIEPVQLQVVCYQLWERLKDRLNPLISVEDVEKAGDVDSALKSFYEETISSALKDNRLSGDKRRLNERQLRQWVETRLITEAGTRGTVYRGEEETAGLPNPLVDTLEKSWLLRSESRAGGRWVELTHDRFVEPILEANRAWEASQNNPLAAVTRLWLANGRDAARLLKGQQLLDAQSYAKDHAEMLTVDEQTLLALSVRRQAEERQAARQAAVLRRNLFIIGTLLLLLFGGLAWWGISNYQIAQGQLARLEGEKLLKEARSRKERIIQAALGSEGIKAPFVSPLSLPVATTAFVSVTTPFTSYVEVVGEVAVIRKLLEEALAADPTLQLNLAEEKDDVLRQAATRLVQEGERLAAQKNHDSAAIYFQAAFELQPPPDTLLYVWIAPGEFTMGSSEADSQANDNEKLAQKMTLAGFWMMRTEVTNAQYDRCVQAKVCEPPSNSRYNNLQFALHPVTDVYWSQAKTYAEWVGGRLPSEAQWEMACRGSEGRIYPWGNAAPKPEIANYTETGLNTWSNVGSYPKGATPNGLLDMAGNVWEWTSSEYKAYPYNAEDGREQPNKDVNHTVRGGAFYWGGDTLRCAARLDYDYVGYYLDGLRVVSPGF